MSSIEDRRLRSGTLGTLSWTLCSITDSSGEIPSPSGLIVSLSVDFSPITTHPINLCSFQCVTRTPKPHNACPRQHKKTEQKFARSMNESDEVKTGNKEDNCSFFPQLLQVLLHDPTNFVPSSEKRDLHSACLAEVCKVSNPLSSNSCL